MRNKTGNKKPSSPRKPIVEKTPQNKKKKKIKSPEKQKLKPKKKETAEKKSKDSLLPLIIILIILLSLTLFMTFSSKSSFLSDLFSKNHDAPPLIERPIIEQDKIVKPENNESNSYTVTNEDEIKAEEETVEDKTDLHKTMKSRLFFVKVSDEGQISLKSVIRTINYDKAPLRETLNSLIKGPERSELNKGLLNLIPQDSNINSINITKGVAFIDFNEEFSFNSLGIEGYKAQLMQIVYTATEFQTVNKVQILINGKNSEYLGAEGIYIGDPIDREYFNTF